MRAFSQLALVAFFLFNSSTSGLANPCSPAEANLSHLPPIRNQDDLGWCQSFTAADQFSAALGFPVSAADLHARSIKRKYETFASYGTRKLKPGEPVPSFLREMRERSLADEGLRKLAAIDEGIEGGVCLESDFPSEDYESSALSQRMHAKSGSELTMRLVVQMVERGQAKIAELNDPQLTCNTGQVLANLFRGYPEARYAEDVASADLPIVAAAKALSLVCEGKRLNTSSSLETDRWLERTPGSEKSAIGFLDRNVEDHRIVGVNMLWRDFAGGGDDRHAVSIVGRKDFGGRCFYRVRNSWGAGKKWRDYCAGLAQSGSAQLFCDKNEAGYMWISRAVAEEAITEASVVKKRQPPE